ncbi:CS domain [Seminavis robusta]|uniref:NudC domain-containing protein 1 n=1 Tax=Seminavis robusta TaxID=568900 RepID=A0A9N8HQV9_9STRA|nr:CS domain [Seminavis robusta]|eukprot:Sro1199_g251770.1 CS domain (361) ;mRNA; r:21404-22486
MTEEKDEKEMTFTEREQWLRDRGVEIVNPGQKAAESAADGVLSITQQLSKLDVDNEPQGPQADGSVPFVLIPCDDTKPLRTLRVPPKSGGGGDWIPDYIKPHFADSKSIDVSLLQQQATKHFAGGQLEDLAKNGNQISAAAMNAVAAEGSVETFPLVHPSVSNNSQGVYIYLDEVGLLKKLPPNRRATQLATGCGYHPPPQFYGDVFVGRVGSKPVLRNLPFCAGIDTDPAAPWLLAAPQENVAWQQEMNRVTNRQGASQPAHAGTEGTQVEEDNYAWSQEDDDVELVVSFDNDIDKKQLKVKFLSKNISVIYQGNPKLSLKLYAAIDVDACTWTIDGGKKLVITCEKANPGELWPRVKE